MAKTAPHPITRLHTEKQEAERLAISVRTLQFWRVVGGGPPYLKIGRAVRYNPEQVDAWLADLTRTNTAMGDAA